MNKKRITSIIMSKAGPRSCLHCPLHITQGRGAATLTERILGMGYEEETNRENQTLVL